MGDLESIGTLYVLSIKGGYYNSDGQITEELSNARFFPTSREAADFQKHHDSRHRVDRSTLLKLTIFITEEEP